ncbi:hypothetical protein [Clostridium minihomine]|uniref:hypothetical protein n=1 Tax=Clostridium minihomine TaxID=2045012 RepID=UPI000C76E6DB|nr:hypothetical protein [Clostridium minihomine]
MEDGLSAFPVGFLQFFESDRVLKDYFLGLPEEDQQALLREEMHSAQDLYECIARHKMKQ